MKGLRQIVYFHPSRPGVWKDSNSNTTKVANAEITLENLMKAFFRAGHYFEGSFSFHVVSAQKLDHKPFATHPKCKVLCFLS